jgi:hypothetical protein
MSEATGFGEHEATQTTPTAAQQTPPAAPQTPPARPSLWSRRPKFLGGQGGGTQQVGGITLPEGAQVTPNADGSLTVTTGKTTSATPPPPNGTEQQLGNGGIPDESGTGQFVLQVKEKPKMDPEEAVEQALIKKFHNKEKGKEKQSLVRAIKIPEVDAKDADGKALSKPGVGMYELHVSDTFSRSELVKLGFNAAKAGKLNTRGVSKDPKPYDVWEITKDAAQRIPGYKEGMDEKAIAEILQSKNGEKTIEAARRGLVNAKVTLKPASEGAPEAYIVENIEPGTPRNRVFGEGKRDGVTVTHKGGGPKIIQVPANVLEQAAGIVLGVDTGRA